MARQFDYVRWVESVRCRRGVTESSSDRVKTKFELDVTYIDKLMRLIEWCATNKLTVKFISNDVGHYDASTNTVSLSHRTLPETQLYTLLHELGHYLIETQDDEWYNERYVKGWKTTPSDDVSFHYKIDTLAEEFDAWYNGLLLAKRLSLDINVERFFAMRNTCLKTYVKIAANL